MSAESEKIPEGAESENDKVAEEERNLDDELAALDLDTDFLASGSMDESDVDDDDDEVPPIEEPSSQEPQNDQPAWAERTEIYSRHFKPNPQEREALEAIAQKLGVKSNLPKTGGFVNPLDKIVGGIIKQAFVNQYSRSKNPSLLFSRFLTFNKLS